ncbi:peptidylprolyl isomerase [Aurantiacibacter marinus]|uniref:Peptidylprolyl isomerase n=1 Tax=Aurantiacibacter marinus TaxID=874156 RepID=A0A0H0XLQ5_9SPHN|nr:peptidylprolyl isomerase [Aurantiacibacter marinus]KLI62926.1 peptidylprolyl isomerase [Aurantiacibacter marinus]
MIHRIALAALPLLLPMAAIAQEAPEPATPGSVIAAAAPEEWTAIPAEDLLVMELAPDTAGNARRVVIQLIPAPFSQPWVENIRTLAAAHWWDGTSVNRVQDNYVTQWGDLTEDKPLPHGVVAPEAAYEASDLLAKTTSLSWLISIGGNSGNAGPPAPPLDGRDDLHAALAGFGGGWPMAWYGYQASLQAWPIHCYGYVGVGRGYAPDTGTGAELYTIIGQPQRHMDRNLAVVGRIIDGMEHLSSLPRGSGDLGFYTDEEDHLRTAILSVRLASETADPPSYEYLDTASETFARYVNVRANRDDAFYTVPAGGVDVCSVQVPVRQTGS